MCATCCRPIFRLLSERFALLALQLHVTHAEGLVDAGLLRGQVSASKTGESGRRKSGEEGVRRVVHVPPPGRDLDWTHPEKILNSGLQMGIKV